MQIYFILVSLFGEPWLDTLKNIISPIVFGTSVCSDFQRQNAETFAFLLHYLNENRHFP